ncbi:acyltransferase [Spirosoma sp. BT702]|uniref:Acyltransferase n=1 Tax=Spirosoma profusum TaxID=2771354 RepID=A0A927AMX9_9BACT|nr:acyltransferase family protein [Spirosoma profusum]MBD2700709.1 acyltransferase [Spirosoma profusum]
MNQFIQNTLLGPVGILPAIFVLISALLSITVLYKSNRIILQSVKYESFDALKGYLSIIVFICHSITWYYYLRTRNWFPPPSNAYHQIGQASISMFFMMTSFLFCNKLLKGQTNWLKLYIGRIFRLFPVYFLSIFCLFLIIGYLSNFSLNENESILTITSQFKKWILFTMKDWPNVNGIQKTWIIIAHITWTLRYEWLFYLALPVISILFFNEKPNLLIISISLYILFVVLPYKDYSYINFIHFGGGILASLLIRFGKFSHFTYSWPFSIIIFLLILLLVTIEGQQLFHIAITAAIFIIIACGNTIFGVLLNKYARALGQVSYGIYLFHGIVFFIFFRFILGYEKAATLSSAQHWVCIILLTPLIILIASLIHIYIEFPAMQLTPLIYQKIHEITSATKHKARIYWHQVVSFK